MSDDVTGVLDSIDNALDDWAVSGDAMRWTPDAEAVRPVVTRFPSVQVTITPQTFRFIEQLEEAMRQVGEVFAKAVPKLLALGRAIERAEERAAAQRHQPVALKVDGREYRRRSRKR